MKKKLLITLSTLSFLFLLLVVYVRISLYPQFPIANGYAAKKMCSCIFIAERSQESIQEEDLGFGPLSLTLTKVDELSKSVTSSIFGLVPRTAVYKGDVGCVLLQGEDDYAISLDVDRPGYNVTAAWPYGEALSVDPVSGVDYVALQRAINNAFDVSRRMDTVMTRAVVVIYKDTLIGEAYAKGFDANTEILGWSMTKSITATMIGMLIKDGRLSLDDDHLFEEWEGDDRADITLRDLMQMQSGLAFDENYGAVSDATNMLFQSEDISLIPMAQPLEHEIGEHWSYSSGTTNLLSELVRRKINSQDAYLRYPYEGLFDKIGMHTAVMETDESGHFIGSSYLYATPRDWAKFGLLYLNQGNWYGEQIVDTSFVDFIKTPASNSDGKYGGQFWLNAEPKVFPNSPDDIFYPSGFQGQHVFIIPSYDVVIVRMGLAEWPVFNPDKLISEVLASLEKPMTN